jgi:glycosyltransferase involved in cell wall biosynthesis
MALGKSVIISDLPPLRKLVIEGFSDLICIPDSVMELQNAIRRLYESEQDRLTIGSAARRWIVHKRSQEVILQKYLEFYSSTNRAKPV